MLIWLPLEAIPRGLISFIWMEGMAGRVPPQELARVRAADQAAIEAGERLVFVPVFYALVRV